MLKIVGIVVVVLIVAAVAVVAYASTRPDAFRVQRSTSIKAPPDRIFPLIVDYRNWPQWSPYEGRDPDMKRIFSGAPSGNRACGPPLAIKDSLRPAILLRRGRQYCHQVFVTLAIAPETA